MNDLSAINLKHKREYDRFGPLPPRKLKSRASCGGQDRGEAGVVNVMAAVYVWRFVG